tara:strand:+ start:270 stop:704 length:435 start_codon:yes stop_codon:yes gene_type:complete
MPYQNQDESIFKAKPVRVPEATDKDSWSFIGDNVPNLSKAAQRYAKRGNEKAFEENADHKVLKVKFVDKGLDQKEFLITVPSHFFTDGEYTASPIYKEDEVIFIKHTGDNSIGCAVPWVDANINERGGKGGGTSESSVACAKWS